MSTQTSHQTNATDSPPITLETIIWTTYQQGFTEATNQFNSRLSYLYIFIVILTIIACFAFFHLYSEYERLNQKFIGVEHLMHTHNRIVDDTIKMINDHKVDMDRLIEKLKYNKYYDDGYLL